MFKKFIYGFVTLICTSCLLAAQPIIPFTVIHVNDVYEMLPIGNGQGGLTKVAGLKQQLTKAQPDIPIITVLAGDLLNPSSLSAAKIDGKPLWGINMVDVANEFLDYMTFGNHEFDLPEQELNKRIAQSKFTWISSNVFDKNNKPFAKVLTNHIKVIKYQGKSVTVGLFALTLDQNQKKWVIYDNDYIKIAKEQIASLKAKGTDIIIALTHLNLKNDIEIATALPEIDIILGGHEHENMNVYRGLDLTPIFKADLNARTAYIHNFKYNIATKKLNVVSTLKTIDNKTPNTAKVLKIANKWQKIAVSSLEQNGIDPKVQLINAPFDLNGIRDNIRYHSNDLTKIIANTLLNASKADLAFISAGQIRNEDIIYKGQALKVMDILRIWPFSSDIVTYSIPGSTLLKIVAAGSDSIGTSNFLHFSSNFSQDKINPDKFYTVASIEYLMSGRPKPLKFLKTPEKYGIKKLNNYGDVRQALIKRFTK